MVNNLQPRLQRLHTLPGAATVSVLRLDELDPYVTGNKGFKLKYNLLKLQAEGHDRLLTFGGAYSNHLVAVAAAGKRLAIETIGVVRGELIEPLNPRLRFALRCGMRLHAMSRADYQHKESEQILSGLRTTYGDFYCIPEGGGNALGVRGCEEIAGFLTWESSAEKRLVALACGTGSTMAGLIRGLKIRGAKGIEVVGISVINAPGVMASAVSSWLDDDADSCGIRWRTIDDCHFGGYAKTSPALCDFVAKYSSLHDIPLEPVYTGKLFWWLDRELQSGQIQQDTEVILIHSGGLFPADTP